MSPHGQQKEQTTEDCYLIAVHHLAQILWWWGAGEQALDALTNLVMAHADERTNR